MLINVDGELLDGFHFEEIPQFNTDDKFSEDALGWLPGMRAVWLLYRHDRWDYLLELGVVRSVVELRLSALGYEDVLTKKQAYWLSRRVPEMETASARLRMKYALLYRMKELKHG